MNKQFLILGEISAQPRVNGDVTEFVLDNAGRSYRIARTDPQWQKKDVLFLCIGQRVAILGRETEDCILAEEIRITDCTKRNYLGEDLYGDSGVPGADPGNSEIQGRGPGGL